MHSVTKIIPRTLEFIIDTTNIIPIGRIKVDLNK